MMSITLLCPGASVKLTEKLFEAAGLIGVAPDPEVSVVLKLLMLVIVVVANA